MKKHLHNLIFMLAALLFANAMPAKACVDYHPQPFTTVSVDTQLQFIEIVVHNMHLYGGSNGEFCTCAITAYDEYYDAIYYVAFLDSATGLPEPGFAPWGSNSQAGESWATFSPSFEWNAYVATVTGGGLTPGKPVNLLVRASLTPGMQFFEIDSLLYGTLIATDAYDSVNHVVSNMHNSISGTGFTGEITVLPSAYFTGVPGTAAHQIGATVFPNPAAPMTAFAWPAAAVRTLRLYNAVGQELRRVRITSAQYHLFRNGLPAGAYMYSVEHENGYVEKGKILFR